MGKESREKRDQEKKIEIKVCQRTTKTRREISLTMTSLRACERLKIIIIGYVKKQERYLTLLSKLSFYEGSINFFINSLLKLRLMGIKRKLPS